MPDQEIVPFPTVLPPAVRPATAMVSGVTAIIPRNIGEVLEVARIIISAKLAPNSYEGRNEQETVSRVVIGIMKGSEVGFPPITALSTIAIVNNRACIWGDGAVALVQSRGIVDKIEETWEGVGDVGKTDPIPNDFGNDFTCVFRIWRKGQPNPYEGRYSVRDAKRANLWGRKQPWVMYPKRMLLARARAYALRDGFADALMGLAIAEEIQDLPAEAVKVSTSFLDDAPALPAPAQEALPAPAEAPPEVQAPEQPPAAEPTPAPAAAPVQHDDDRKLTLDSPEVTRPPLAGPDPEPELQADPEPTEVEIAGWTDWGTKMTEKLATVGDLAGLAKLERHFQVQSRDYLAVLGAEKRLAMEELIANRRQELSSEDMQ